MESIECIASEQYQAVIGVVASDDGGPVIGPVIGECCAAIEEPCGRKRCSAPVIGITCAVIGRVVDR